jgi:ABC-type transport system substrate-binding protein
MGIYLQVYNLAVDETSHKSNAEIDYAIRRGEETIVQKTETTTELGQSGQQITLEKVLSLDSFTPGDYTVQITVRDRVRGQSVEPTATFRVLP